MLIFDHEFDEQLRNASNLPLCLFIPVIIFPIQVDYVLGEF